MFAIDSGWSPRGGTSVESMTRSRTWWKTKLWDREVKLWRRLSRAHVPRYVVSPHGAPLSYPRVNSCSFVMWFYLHYYFFFSFYPSFIHDCIPLSTPAMERLKALNGDSFSLCGAFFAKASAFSSPFISWYLFSTRCMRAAHVHHSALKDTDTNKKALTSQSSCCLAACPLARLPLAQQLWLYSPWPPFKKGVDALCQVILSLGKSAMSYGKTALTCLCSGSDEWLPVSIAGLTSQSSCLLVLSEESSCPNEERRLRNLSGYGWRHY